MRDLQHLLPGAKQAFPQQPPPSPWHGKVLPFTFTQQVSPRATHTSPQQLSPPAQVKLSPLRLRQCTGGSRRRVCEFTSDVTSDKTSSAAFEVSDVTDVTFDPSCENPTNPLAHSVSLVTGYHWLLGLKWDLQHLLPGAKQAFPQQPPPSPWHGKV